MSAETKPPRDRHCPLPRDARSIALIMRMRRAFLDAAKIARLVFALVPVRQMVKPQFAMTGRARYAVAVKNAMDPLVEMRPALRAADAGLEMFNVRMHAAPHPATEDVPASISGPLMPQRGEFSPNPTVRILRKRFNHGRADGTHAGRG